MSWALLLTTFTLGLRHGIDWDHLAAISDITGSETEPRAGLWLSFLYALGHGAIVLLLGAIAVSAGELLPEGFDRVMTRFVGASLILLSFFVFYSLIRYRERFRPRSRWMLALGAARRTAAWLGRRRSEMVEIIHDHEHPIGPEHGHTHVVEGAPRGHAATATKVATHGHAHRHVLPVPHDPFESYTGKAALGVGAIHGVGAETPTQVLLFISAAGVGSAFAGMLLLVTFLLGLFISNIVLATLLSWGFHRTRRTFPLYAALGGIAGLFSLSLGASLVLGGDPLG